jgi:hypothetical protein
MKHTTSLVNTTASVAFTRSFRHRVIGAWCDVVVEAYSFMPNTKYQRLREPSHG